jgi:hypothetical protein
LKIASAPSALLPAIMDQESIKRSGLGLENKHSPTMLKCGRKCHLSFKLIGIDDMQGPEVRRIRGPPCSGKDTPRQPSLSGIMARARRHAAAAGPRAPITFDIWTPGLLFGQTTRGGGILWEKAGEGGTPARPIIRTSTHLACVDRAAIACALCSPADAREISAGAIMNFGRWFLCGRAYSSAGRL